ncbi:TonB-dependent receptor [Archangium gephyra]|uniref:TonB-dependent receptor domain-containing protein n=1 Tax=Archangium gephyra TaxID=48 RepID=UPI0035D4A621
MHSKRMLWMAGAVVVAILFHAEAAHATSVIFGTVVGAENKKPVPDVIVTATSPGFEGNRVARTDGLGRYRIAGLPPGSYTLSFVKESFQPYSRSEIRLRLNRTLRVNVELAPPDFSGDVVMAVRPPPLLNAFSTTTELWVDEPYTQLLAVNRPQDPGGASRSFERLAGLAPGVQLETYGLSINGASAFENRYTVDGLSTWDPVWGVNALPLSVEFLQGTNIVTGGFMPEYGRTTGGFIQARTRSGSNEFHGALFGNWAPGFLGGTPTPASGPTSTLAGQNAVAFQGDIGATLSGPILRDRLWIFAGVAPALTRVEHTRTLQALGTPIPNSARHLFANQSSLQAMGKLTYLFDYNNALSLSVISTSAGSGGDGQLTVDPLTGRVRDFINARPSSATQSLVDGGFTTAAFNYSGMFPKQGLWIDANLGWSRQTASRGPTIGAGGLSRVLYTVRRPVTYFEPTEDVVRACGDPSESLERCPVQFYESGGTGLRATDTVDRYQANAQLSWTVEFLGTHTVKAGVDAELLSYERYRDLPGAVVIQEGLSRQETPEGETSPYTSQTLGGFVQDSWTFGRWITLNGGVRYDAQLLYSEDGALASTPGRPLSPRVGLVVDPLGMQRMKLFAHYGQYHGQLPFGVMAGLPIERARIDPKLVAPSTTELVAGAEYRVRSETKLAATYTRRSLDSAIALLSREAEGEPFLGNPGLGGASDFPKAERTQDAVTVALSRVFTGDWLAQASYTWSRLYGNYTGYFRPVSTWGEPALQPDFLLASQLSNRTGPLPEDRTHTVKVFGARALVITPKLSTSLGLSYQGRSGTPINYLGGNALLGMGETFVLPRGSSGERTPWVHTVDTDLRVSYQPAKGQELSLSLEVFNLFNFQAVTRVNEHYTYANVLPLEPAVAPGALTPDMVRTASGGQLTEGALDKEFKKPIQYQAPRQVRLGLRYAF